MGNEIMDPTITTITAPATPKGRDGLKCQRIFAFLLIVSVLAPVYYIMMMSNSLPTRANVDTSSKIYSRHIAKDDMRTFPELESDAPFPRVAWLMSFPNSGTTYTLAIVRKVTGKTTATNYGKECKGSKDGQKHNIPVQESFEQGPFLKNLSQGIPKSGYILTKTHCGGRCLRCGPDSYIETLRMFQRECTKTKTSAFEESVTGHYDPKIVHRAIHLIRDPFDNIVSRFHYELKSFHEDMRNEYPNTAEGFRKWCNLYDDDQNIKKAEASVLHRRFFDKKLQSFKERIPCFAEFYRYTAWHNLAIQTVYELRIPTLVLYYERYESEYEDTVDSIINFLDLDGASEPPEFISGKTYRDYFTMDEIGAAMDMIEELATVDTWELIKHYQN